MTQAKQSMTNRTLSGLFWMTLATGANVFSLLLVLIVLARLLTPADFGLAAAALMVVGFSAIFAELGIGPAIVQRSDLQTAHLRAGFTLSVSLGLLFWCVLSLAAPLIAELFRLEELTPILRVVGLILPVQGLGIVAESLLQRELRFRCIAVLDTVAVVLGYGGVGITLAMLGFAAWSLIAAHLAQACMRTILLLAFRPHPALPLLERRACLDLLRFGGGFTAGRFSNYLAGQGEHLVIGRWLGAVALGVYGRAYHLMAGPAVLFGNVLDRVLFPAMAHMQDEPKRLAEAYRRGNALIALVILPVSAIVVALAPEVVQIILGSEWDAVTLPLQILGVGMLFRTGCKISDSLVRATGAVHRRTWRQTVYAILVVVGAWVGQFWGLEGVAVAILGSLALNFFLMAHLSLVLSGMSWRTFLAAHLPGLALTGVVGIPIAVTANALRSWDVEPIVVVSFSVLALLPSMIAVVCLPGIFLGADGRWMVRKLLSRLFSEGSKPMPDVATSVEDMPLDHPMAALARNLAAQGVRYCCWKSQTDLQRVLSGKGDLDLLVDRSDIGRFLCVAERLGFKRVVDIFGPRRNNEIHLYGLDQETGVLVHVHVSLTLLDGGASCLEELVLQNCLPESSAGLPDGMPVVSPRAELIVFVFRAMEQYASLSACLRLLVHGEKIQAKLQALVAAGAEEGWPAMLEAWLPAVSPVTFAECLAALQKPASWLSRHRLARTLRGHQANQETTGYRDNDLREDRSGSVFAAIWRRLWHGRGNPKTLPGGGIVIAFIGPDASGKSTMVSETTRWLGSVFSVQAAHLGKPPATWLTWLPNRMGRLLAWIAPKMRTFHQSPKRAGSNPGGQGFLYRLRAVLLAWDRRALARRLARLAADGTIVVCDRYPTDEVGAPDSARIEVPQDSNASWLHVLLARLENRLYREIPPPDVVIRLSAPLNVTLDRNRERDKPGKEGDDFVERRHKDFFVPSFAGVQVVHLDTSTSQAESVHVLHQLLWKWLCGPVKIKEASVELQSR